MKWLNAAAVGALLLLAVAPSRAQSPVNPHASPEARALLHYIYSISGHYTLTGQHNYPNTMANWTDRAYDLTGKFPAVYGQDFGFQGGTDKDSILARPALVEEAKRQYRNGAIVTFTWHAVRPTDDEPVTFLNSVQGHLSDYEWHELLTPGTDLYNRWCAQADVIAGYLKQLRDAHVPVLWRQFHEVNGSWFWWGGRKGTDGSAALYRQLFDRFVNYHHLDNLVWVWNANSPGSGGQGPGPYADYFPGLDYADILSVDIYGEFKQSYYDDLKTLAAGKPIALGEVGAVPSPEILKQQPAYAWFMTWSEFVEEATPVDALRATYNAPSVLSRDDPRVAEPMAAIRKASGEANPEPVTSGALPATKELLTKLSRGAGQSVLPGQDNDPETPSGATQRVVEVTGKHPAVYGADLGAVADRPAVVEEAKRQQKNHAVVTLSWHAPRPTDNDSAALNTSTHAKLSDFEWKELLTPGTHLYQRWCEQADSVAAALKQLQDTGATVLWRPYPESNGTQFWWAGRKGAQGSAALYRQLFDRLANHNKLHNLIWVWDATSPGFGPDSPGQYADYFPGLEYVDALQVNLTDARFAFRRDAELARFGVGKPIGFTATGWIPAPGMVEQASKWSWFLISAAEAGRPEHADALRKLYDSPRVASMGTEAASR